jgi:hypothetical protein
MTEETAAPVEGQAAETEAPAVTSWLEGFDADARGYVETKGFKEPADLLNSYRNLEKLRGVPAERLIKLPEKMDDAEAMGEVFDRLGRPEAADKYTRALGDEFNDDVFKGIASEAHKLGLTDAQFAGMQQATAQFAAKVQEAQDAQIASEFDEWKGKNADGFNAAARAMAQAGVSEEQLEGILTGNKAALYDFLAKVGAGLNEAPVTQGDNPPAGFEMTPAAAKSKIQELMADEAFMKQYLSTNQKVRAPAIARMEALQKAAAGGKA